MAEEEDESGSTTRGGAAKGPDPEKDQVGGLARLKVLVKSKRADELGQILETIVRGLDPKNPPTAKLVLQLADLLEEYGAATSGEMDSFAAVLLQSFEALDVVVIEGK